MKEIIDRQISLNEQLNLFFTSLEEAIAVDEEFKAEVLKMKQSGSGNVDALSTYAAARTIESVYGINQYVDIPSDQVRVLEEIYHATWAELDRENFDAVIKRHHRRLSEWLARFYPETFVQALRNRKEIGHVENRAYSVEFQEDLFGIRLQDLLEPVLDLGCGKEGSLVRRLREMGKESVGVDRILASETHFLHQISWFDFVFEKETWGTVISNLAFVNHLVCAFTHKAANLYDYFKKYREITEALKPSGTFLYSPSVPFIEDRLDPERFDIIRKPVTEELAVTRINRK